MTQAHTHKKLLPFILAVLIPFLLILFVIFEIVWQQASVKPRYNFLYSDSKYRYDRTYSVQNQKLKVTEHQTIQPPTYTIPPRLFIYDVKTQTSRQITEEEAKTLILTNTNLSPDGYKVTSDRNGDYGIFPFFFGSSDAYGPSIEGKYGKKQVRLDTYSPYDFHFIGWIL